MDLILTKAAIKFLGKHSFIPSNAIKPRPSLRFEEVTKAYLIPSNDIFIQSRIVPDYSIFSIIVGEMLAEIRKEPLKMSRKE